jgi:glycosyltransferase involved in cell wall biosynthesis
MTREASTQLAPIPAIRNRIVFITTVPETASSFLANQIRSLERQGFEVHTISSPPTEQVKGKIEICGISHEIAMKRRMSPIDDLGAVVQLWRLLRRLRPEIVHTHTPKAGLLGMIAGWLAGVPVRIYTINGLAALTQPFWARVVLGISDWLTCALAHRVLCVSRSVRRFVIASHFCASAKSRMLGDGGSHGVDACKFDPTVHGITDRAAVRKRYGIPENALLLGYIGRLVPDKGVAELTAAWSMLREEFGELRLLLCGYCERDHPLAPGFLERLQTDSRVHFTVERIAYMPPIYAAIDICVLPSYREGLSNVALESAAMQVPIVTTRVPGCIDAVRNGITGLIVEPKNPRALADALRRLITNPELRLSMGARARDFVNRRFSEARISALLLEEYQSLLKWHLGGPKTLLPRFYGSYGEPDARVASITAGPAQDRASGEIFASQNEGSTSKIGYK